jgi:hypothetical protein
MLRGMDWKAEKRHATRAATSIVKPVWHLNRVLGPMTVILAGPLAALIGYVTSSWAWGVATLLGFLFALSFAEVFQRERQAHRSASREATTLALLFDRGEFALDGLHTGHLFMKHDKTDEEFERSRQIVIKDRERAHKWIEDAEQSIGANISPEAARSFRAHPNVTPSLLPSPDLPDHARPLWDDIACRLAWIALRLERLEDGGK